MMASAITAQIVPVDQNKPAVVELTTIVTHPARVMVKSVKSPKAVKLVKTEVASNCKVGPKCKERHKMMFDVSKACRLDGTYAVTMAVNCLPGVKSACKSGQETITLKLKSENFCQSKTVTVPK